MIEVFVKWASSTEMWAASAGDQTASAKTASGAIDGLASAGLHFRGRHAMGCQCATRKAAQQAEVSG